MKTIGIIGLGSIGKRHADNLRAIGHSVIGFDPTIRPGHQWPITGLEKLDGIVIASPTPLHGQHLASAISKRKPVLIEKPIGDCKPEAIQMLLDANRYAGNPPIMVGYNLRFHSCVKKAKEWLDAGLIGKPIWANFTLGQYSAKPPYLRDGVILNWSHEIDLALYLLGAAKVAASSTRLTDGKDDMTDILLTHENGCRSTVHLDYITKPEIRQFTIGGTKGNIVVDLVLRTAQLYGEFIASFDMHDAWNDNYIEEIQAFLDRIDGKQTLGCTGEEGLEVLKICLEVRRQAGLA